MILQVNVSRSTRSKAVDYPACKDYKLHYVELAIMISRSGKQKILFDMDASSKVSGKQRDSARHFISEILSVPEAFCAKSQRHCKDLVRTSLVNEQALCAHHDT